MSYKRKPTVIKFQEDYEKEKFINWAFNKSEPNEGINKAKNAMRLAQEDLESNTIRDKQKKIVVQVVGAHTLSKVKPGRVRRKLRKRDGENAIKTNYRRG